MDNSQDGRDKFGSKFQYMMTSISYSVGLGTVWRFPYLCYKNGGGTFLIPYFITVVFLGLVFFFFESVMGQYTGLGPMKIWNVTPIMKGISMASMVLVCFLSIYYNMLIAWALYFFYDSFQATVPWSICHTEFCTEIGTASFNSSPFVDGVKMLSPSADYFFNVVLEVSDDVKQFGGFRVHLLLCLLIAWITVYICLCFGAEILGKLSVFTTLFPYVMLTALIVQGLMLEGAGDGIVHYLKPDFNKLFTTKLWADAGSQIFYSLSICMGGVITLASYNQFCNNTLRDSIIVVSVNTFTSIFSGFAIFSVIGYLARQLNEPVEKAVDGGVGLAFIAYPAALARMPLSNVWSAVFFIMIVVLGLGSQFTLVETASSNILDQLPQRWKLPKPVVLAFTCILFFILALPMCTGSGYYILQLMDTYAASYSVFALGICEAIALAWFYGADRILDNFHKMANYNVRPRWFWKYMLSYICPIGIFAVLVLSFLNFEPLKIPVKGKDYTFPIEIESVGFFMVLLSISMVPIYAAYQCYRVKRGKIKFEHIFRSPVDLNNNPNNLSKHHIFNVTNI